MGTPIHPWLETGHELILAFLDFSLKLIPTPNPDGISQNTSKMGVGHKLFCVATLQSECPQTAMSLTPVEIANSKAALSESALCWFSPNS